MIPADVQKLAREAINEAIRDDRVGTAVKMLMFDGTPHAFREAVERAIMADRASRLTRQEDETRKAALEEAAKVADTEADRLRKYGRTFVSEELQQREFAASASVRSLAHRIRALKEAGHG